MKTGLWENNISVVLLGKVIKFRTLDDAPPNSLIDSIVSPKVKTTEGKRVGVHFLIRCTSGVKRCAGALGWGLVRVTSELIIHTDLHKPNNKLVSA